LRAPVSAAKPERQCGQIDARGLGRWIVVARQQLIHAAEELFSGKVALKEPRFEQMRQPVTAALPIHVHEGFIRQHGHDVNRFTMKLESHRTGNTRCLQQLLF
jgi:hypothetical protein